MRLFTVSKDDCEDRAIDMFENTRKDGVAEFGLSFCKLTTAANGVW